MTDIVIPNQDNAAALKRWVYENDLTVDELASALGLSLRYVADIVYGTQPIRDKFMGAFLRVYGPTAAAEAFGLTDTPVNQPA